MLRFGRTVLLLLVCATLARGGGVPARVASLENARRAQARLGPGVWTRVIRVENNGAHGKYPDEVFALVFEFGGILWFYTDADGTQSFSLHRNNLAAEKTDFGPLLRDIEPGFASHVVLGNPPDGRRGDDGAPLPNGCFIESIAALRERLARGEAIARAELLSYYIDRDGRRLGHTVLAYETRHGAFAIDPRDDRVTRIGAELPRDALAAARTLRPDLEIAQARWVPTSPPARLAAAGGTGGSNGKAS